MSGDSVTFRVAADTNDAVQAYYRFTQAQKESERAVRDHARATKEADRATREHARAFNQVAGEARAVLGVLGVAGGIAGAVSMISRGVQSWEQHMQGVARATRQAMDALIAFSQVQEKGTLGARSRQVAGAGTEFGFTPVESLASFQAVQSQLGGDYEKARAAFQQIGALRRAGVPMEAGRDVVLVGMGLGYTPGQSARGAYAAGKVSSRTPADIARQAGMALPVYTGIGGGIETGYGVLAELSSVLPVERLGAATARVGRAMVDRAFWRRFGFRQPGADVPAQLEALAARGITTAAQLTRYKMNQEQAEAVSILLRNPQSLRQRIAAIREMMADPGLMAGELAEAEAQLPQLQTGRETARYEQQIEYERTLGKEAEPGSLRDLIRTRRAYIMQRRGMSWLAGEEKKTGPFWFGIGQALSGASGITSGLERQWAETGTIASPLGERDKLIWLEIARRGLPRTEIPQEERHQLTQKIDELIKSLGRNSAATDANTPSPAGAARNAPGNE